MTNLILTLESSTNICAIILQKEKEIIDSFFSEAKNQHDKIMAEEIRNIFKRQNISASDINFIGVNQGPGSFTGLRVGASIAKGLAFGSSMQLIPYSFFDLCQHDKNITDETKLILHSHGPFHYATNAKDFNQSSKIELIEVEDGENYFGITNNPKIELINSHNPIIINSISQVVYNKYLNKKFVSHFEFVPNYHQNFIVKK